MKFTKMHGIGNDYIYVNCFEEKVEDPSRLAIVMSRYHFGVGSDGLILIGPSDTADFSMRIFNSDGSEADMCGNGIRHTIRRGAAPMERKICLSFGMYIDRGVFDYENNILPHIIQKTCNRYRCKRYTF